MATKPTGKGSQYIKVVADHVDEVRAMLELLSRREVLVGFPEDSSAREVSPDEDPDITNAALGYIHNTGMPEQNIPARPFMEPGLEEAKDAITRKLAKTAKRVLKREGLIAIEQGFTEVGLAAQFALRRKINEGVPPPLSEYTLRQRAKKGRKGAQKELDRRAQGEAPSTQFAKPLIATGQLRNAINYVIRPRRQRNK